MTFVDEPCFSDGLSSVWSAPLATRDINTPTEIQKLVIPRILERQNVLFCSPTGTGKTLAYLLPLLQLIYTAKTAGNGASRPSALILAPTIELSVQIKAVADGLTAALATPVSTVLIKGGANVNRQKADIKQLKPDLIIGSARRLIDLARARNLRLSHIQYLVLDEADRLASPEMLPDTQALVALLPRSRVNIACSATISSGIQQKLTALINASVECCTLEAYTVLRSTISHWAIWCERQNSIALLAALLTALHARRVLIFAGNKDHVNTIHKQLHHQGIQTRPLYSELPQQERRNALNDFREGTCRALVATDIGARGLDIPGLTHVISLGVPEAADIYVHRAGRTGRAVTHGTCISLGDTIDMRRLQAIERKTGIVIHPKELYKGKLYHPADLDAVLG